MNALRHDDTACMAPQHEYTIVATYYPTAAGRPTDDDRRKALHGGYGCCRPGKAKGRAREWACDQLRPGMSVRIEAWRPTGRRLMVETMNHPHPAPEATA